LASVLLGTCLVVQSLPAEAQRGAKAAASEYDAVQVLLLARYLELTEEQVKAIVPIATELAATKAALTKGLDAQQEAGGKTLGQVIAAWAAGKPAGAKIHEAADTILDNYDQTYDAYDATVIGATDKMMDLLSAAQKRLVETAAETERREARAAARGIIPPTEYVVSQLKIVRSLEPADYEAVRVLLSRDMATYIMLAMDFPPATLWPISRALLRIMDEVMDMSNAAFADLLPDLPGEIADRLRLPEAPEPLPPRLSLGQLDEFLTNPATAKLLGEMQFPEAQVPPPPLYGLASPDLEVAVKRLHETTDPRHKLEQLIDTMDILSVFNDLDIAPGQVAALQLFVANLQQAYATQQQQWQDALPSHRENLGKIHEALAKNQPLTEELMDALAQVQQAEAEAAFQLLTAAAAHLRPVYDILDEDQNMDIDWRPPRCVVGVEPLEEKLDRLLEVAGEINDFSRFLREVRYMEPIGYQDAATQMTRDFLDRYIPENAPDFEDAVTYLIDVQAEAREWREERWDESVAAMLAIEAMIGLRLLPEGAEFGTGPTSRPDAPYTWWDMERIFSDPLTPKLLTTIMGTAGTGQD